MLLALFIGIEKIAVGGAAVGGHFQMQIGISGQIHLLIQRISDGGPIDIAGGGAGKGQAAVLVQGHIGHTQVRSNSVGRGGQQGSDLLVGRRLRVGIAGFGHAQFADNDRFARCV